MAEGLLGLGVLPERAEIKRGLLDFLGTSPAQDDPVAAQDAPKPARNIVMDYFNTYVGPEELGASDIKRLYDSKRDAYKVYQNK